VYTDFSTLDFIYMPRAKKYENGCPAEYQRTYRIKHYDAVRSYESSEDRRAKKAAWKRKRDAALKAEKALIKSQIDSITTFLDSLPDQALVAGKSDP
jgi:hypothetical protein